MASAEEINDSIEPGSLAYGDRQVVEDRIRQASQSKPAPHQPGSSSAATAQRLESGPVSDLPVTAGLSMGPGAGPMANEQPIIADQYRTVAENARNPLLRKLARDALRATLRHQ